MSRRTAKILSVAAVLLMLGTLLTAVAFVSGANGDENGNLTISVQDTDVNPVNGYYVELYDVLNGKKYVYEDLSFTTTIKDITPGYYEVVFPTQEIGSTVYFRENRTVSIYPAETSQIDFTVSYAKETLTIMGYVKSDSGDALANATVTVKDTGSDFSKTAITNATGYYETSIYNGSFLIEMDYTGYVVNYTYIPITADTWVNGTLTTKPYVWGSVLDENGEVVSGEVRIILHDKNSGETFLHVSDTGAYMVPIYKGNFSMFVNAEGYDTYYVPSVDCDGNSVHLGDITLEKSMESSMKYRLSFNNDDFNSLKVEQTWKISPSETINALPGADMGNLRLQIDYAFGNMDGNVNTSEAASFVSWMDSHQVLTSTASLISVNGTYYKLDNTSISKSVQGITGDVSSASPLFVNTTFDMNSYSSIEADSDVPFQLSVKYDGFTNYSYSIDLPSGYERTGTESPSNVDISGFTTIDIDPKEGTGTATVSFTAEKSLAGNASIDVATGDYVYEREDLNDTYIIQVKKDTTFTAVFTDPNGNEEYANYSWNFGDGSTKYGKRVEHNYSSSGEYKVVLTVKEAGGNITTAEVTMQADGTPPTPRMNTNASTENGVYVADENQVIEFNASNSYDIIIGTEKVDIGLKYEWDFGDNSTSTQKVVDHKYDKWGTYTVKLTVIDAVGNSANITRNIRINDTTPPVARFNWTVDTGTATVNYSYDKSGSINIKEGNRVIFNADPSYDPDGYNEKGVISSYHWTLKKGDEEISLPNPDSMVVEYTFETPGTYTITLNVTDNHGNYDEATRIVDVKYGPRPRLEVTNLTLSTNAPREGERIYIIANVSNFGDADANSPNVVFYVNDNPLSGNVKFYKYENGSLVETAASIPKGEFRIVKIAWTPAQQTYTIRVNATDPQEPTGSSITHEKEIKVTVGPAAWKTMIPLIILIVVIVAIIGVYYAYTKGIGPFGEGGGKQEKKKEKKK